MGIQSPIHKRKQWLCSTTVIYFWLDNVNGEREQLNLNQKIILGVKDKEYDNG
jgi:hypothetical protein